MKVKDHRYQQFVAEDIAVKEAKKREMEEAREAKKEAERERLRKYREELAEQNRKAEEEAEIEEVFIEEFECIPCKKTFKKEGQLNNHLNSKKHKDVMKQLKQEVTLDEDAEQLA